MQTSIPTQPSTTTTKVVVATTVALTFITFWQAAAIVLNDLASTMYLHRRHHRAGHRQVRALDGAGRDALQLRRPLRVHGKLRHVRARRRVRRGARTASDPPSPSFPSPRWWSTTSSPAPSARSAPGQYLGRLLNDIAETLASDLAHRPELLRRVLQRRRHRLLLVQQHQRRSRIQPQSPAHHADHHGDGGDPADLVPPSR